MPIIIACIETRMVGTAMRSSGPKSLIVLTFGLRVSMRNGTPAMPLIDLIAPLVLPQASSMLETPVIATSIESERIASVITPPEVMIDHFTFTSFRPSAAACFSISFFSSMMMAWR